MARYQEENQQLQSMPDTGGAEVANALAQKLSAFGSFVGKERAAKVVEESQKLGTKAGLEGAPTLKSESSLAGQAFNKSAVAAYSSGIENDFRENIARIAQENPDDIATFTTKAEAYRMGALQGIPENLRDQMQVSLETHISRAGTAVQGNAIQKQKQEIQFELQSNASGSANSAATLARAGDEDGSILEQMKANDVIDSMDIMEQDKAKLKTQFNTERVEQKYKGVADRLYADGGIDAVNQWLTDNEGKPLDGLDLDASEAITDAIQVDANRKASRERAQKNLATQEGKQSLKDYANAKSLGFEVDKAEEQNLISLIKDTPELMEQKKIIDDVAKFSVMPADSRQQVIEAAKTGKLKDVNRYASMIKADAEINKLAQKDGYTLGTRQGIVEFVPFDMADASSFKQRIDQAAILSEHYGVAVSPLADAEVQAITDNLPSMTINEKIALASTLNAAPTLWNEIDKKGAGTFAMAGATGDVNVMTPVFKGQELLASGLVKQPSANEYLPEFQELTEGVYGTRDSKALLDATMAHYAATSSSATSGIFNRKDFEASVQAVSGGIGEINGYKIELPRGIDEDTFEDFIDDIQPETIESLGGVANYSNDEAVNAIQEGRIRNIGNNRYVIETNGGTLFNRKGEPFILSYSLETASTNTALSQQRQFKTRKQVQDSN